MKKKKSCRGCERELRRECFSPSKRPKKKKKKNKKLSPWLLGASSVPEKPDPSSEAKPALSMRLFRSEYSLFLEIAVVGVGGWLSEGRREKERG